MSLPVERLYVDSTFRTPDSQSSSSFKFQLARNIRLPKNTVFFVDDVCIPNTWLTIETDVNDVLYIVYGGVELRVKIAQGQYAASALGTAINAAFSSNATVMGKLTCTTNTAYSSLTISTTGDTFILPTDDDLKSRRFFATNPDTIYNDFQNCNDVINNTSGPSPVYSTTKPFSSGFLTLTHSCLYITSPNIGTYTTLGARGESDIIKKVPITSMYGYLVVDSFSSNHDFLDCSDQTLNMLEFQIKDVGGKVVNLHGYNVSFTIVFAQHNEDGLR